MHFWRTMYMKKLNMLRICFIRWKWLIKWFYQLKEDALLCWYDARHHICDWFFHSVIDGNDVPHIVLGVQWLLSLGPILWNFSREKRYVCLKRVTIAGSNLIDNKEIKNFFAMEHAGVCLQLLSSESKQQVFDDG